MTNTEYKKLAQYILKQFDFNENPNDKITHISELFFIKIREALLKSKREQSAFIIAKEWDDIQNHSQSDNDKPKQKDKTNLSIYETSDSNDNSVLREIEQFRCIQFTIESFPNAEKILTRMGINNPKLLIQKIKFVDRIENEDDWTIVLSIMKEFENVNEDNKLFFFALSKYYLIKENLLKALEVITENQSLSILKRIKIIGDKYKDIYLERFQKYVLIFQHFDEYFDKHGDAIMRSINHFAEIGLHYKDIFNPKKLDDFIENNEIDFSFSPALVLDFLFLIYLITYEIPLWIFVGFFFTSSKVPLNLHKAMIKAFKESKYAPLIQYEYEYFRDREEIDAIPIPFYTGSSVGLDSFGIIDYNFDKYEIPNYLQSLTSKKVSEDKQEEEIPTDIKQIEHDLEPFLVVFDGRSSKKKGAVFLKDYLSDVITLSKSISGSLAVHGFAYILFKSRYLNWDKIAFDDNFVFKIAQIFHIENKIGTRYVESKAKQKAKRLLEDEKYEKLQGLLDEHTKKKELNLE